MVCQAQEGGWGALCSVGMGPGAPVAGRGLLGGGAAPFPSSSVWRGLGNASPGQASRFPAALLRGGGQGLHNTAPSCSLGRAGGVQGKPPRHWW